MKDYTCLRQEMRAFYPEKMGNCASREVVEAGERARQLIRQYASEHPDYDALELRKVSYKAIADCFVPTVFRNLPFYYEAGVNGGWTGVRPAQTVSELCRKFMLEHVPQEAMDKFRARHEQKYILCCGFFTDEIHHIPPLSNLLKHGFGGYHAKAVEALKTAKDEHERKLLEASIAGLEAVHEIQLKFAAAADAILANEQLTAEQGKFMRMMAEAARRSPWEPPRTFYEGLNLLWFTREILGYLDELFVFALGRIDAFLIDLYKADLAAGRLTREEAYDLICRFLISADCHYDSNSNVEGYNDHELEIPLTLGGCDTQGHPVFNDITRMVLKAHLELDIVFPKLHCRFSQASPSEYLRTIADMLMKSHCVFAMFNDDCNIAGLVRMGVPLEQARNYIGTGCWDGYVDSVTEVDTANYISVARVLEAMIYRDEETERKAGIALESLDDCPDFDSLLKAFYGRFIAFLKDVLHDYTEYGRFSALTRPHPLYSVCLTGCLESRKDVTEGGCLYKPRIMTMAFMANVVDSLCAIKTLCFERKVCTLHELLEAVRHNWQGAEELRGQAMAAPHWGDDSELSNRLMGFFFNSVHRDIADLKNERGGPYLVAAWIYREYRFWGEKMKALPDGRHDGDYLSQGLVPSEFRCHESITTVLNAIGSIDHSKVFASNCNLSFDRGSVSIDMFEAIFRTFAAKGMHLLQPNCVSREELLDAQVHPEHHASIMIKVCGFSARFIALSKEWQQEVLRRHRF